MLSRLLPFVEKRINLIELAPKETGKSYVFAQISKYGWLVSGGSISRAKMFYDISKRTQGLVSRYDYVHWRNGSYLSSQWNGLMVRNLKT